MDKNNNFFDDKIFEEESEQDVLEVENIDFDNVEEDEPTEENETVLDDSDDYIEIGYMFVSLFEDTRATAFSLLSGKPQEKYYHYKKKNSKGVYELSKEDPMVLAAAKVARKHQFKFGPEFLLIIGLIVSTIYLAKIANDDRKEKKAKDKKAKSEDEKPI